METSDARPGINKIGAGQMGDVAGKLERLGIGSLQIQETAFELPRTVAAFLHAMRARPAGLADEVVRAMMAAPEQLATALEQMTYDRYGPFLFTLRGLVVDSRSNGQSLPADFDPNRLSGYGFHTRSASADRGWDMIRSAERDNIERFGQAHLWWAMNHPDEVPHDWFNFGQLTGRRTLAFPGTMLFGPEGQHIVPAMYRSGTSLYWTTLDLSDGWGSSAGCLCDKRAEPPHWLVL